MTCSLNQSENPMNLVEKAMQIILSSGRPGEQLLVGDLCLLASILSPSSLRCRPTLCDI